jgi:hypothetical protein
VGIGWQAEAMGGIGSGKNVGGASTRAVQQYSITAVQQGKRRGTHPSRRSR